MNGESTLRIFIDERWTIDELSSFIDTLQYFNDILLYRNRFPYRGRHDYYDYDDEFEYNPLFYWINKYIDKDILVYNYGSRGGFKRIKTYTKSPYAPETRLKLIRFQYASPGIVDIAGIGKIIEQIKDLIIELFKLSHNYKENKYRRNDMHLEQLARELSVGREIYDTLRDIGYSESDLNRIWEFDLKKIKSISELIERGKIQKIEKE
nr:hypothetical protein [uncultured Carboxylicivirga sp.]